MKAAVNRHFPGAKRVIEHHTGGPQARPRARRKKSPRPTPGLMQRRGSKNRAAILAEIYSRPVADLARELGCKPVEAHKLQQDAAAQLLPYLHSKAPIEVTGKDGRAVSLFIGIMAAPEGGSQPGDGAKTIIQGRILSPEEIEQNQDDSAE